jgi:hypothetical protein
MEEQLKKRASWVNLEQETRTYSRNAQEMIMSYNDRVYYVNSVNVNLRQGREVHEAVFHAREMPFNRSCDLHFEIPHMLCDILIEYAKLDNQDAILVLNVKGNNFTWDIVSEAWLKQTSKTDDIKKYVA